MQALHLVVPVIPDNFYCLIAAMKSPWKSLFNGLEIVSSVGVVLAEIALAVLLILVFHEVVARYVFNNPTLYSVEISEYLLIFIAFMAAGWVMKNNGHVRMSSVISLMPLRMRQFADVFTSIIVFCFCAILVWQGMKSSLMAFTGGYHSSSLLNVPLWIPYAIIPLGSLILALQMIVRIGNTIAGLTTKEQS